MLLEAKILGVYFNQETNEIKQKGRRQTLTTELITSRDSPIEDPQILWRQEPSHCQSKASRLGTEGKTILLSQTLGSSQAQHQPPLINKK